MPPVKERMAARGGGKDGEGGDGKAAAGGEGGGGGREDGKGGGKTRFFLPPYRYCKILLLLSTLGKNFNIHIKKAARVPHAIANCPQLHRTACDIHPM